MALFIHFQLSEIEKNETGQKNAEQIAKEALEVISVDEPYSNLGETSEEKTEIHSEEDESAE
jgi:hypothetical protein